MPGPTSATHPLPWLAYLSLAASMALVGSYVGLSKLLLAAFPVFLLAWLRFGIAALAMAHWVRRAPHEPPLSVHERALLFWQSFLGNFLFSVCMLYGVLHTSAVAAGVVMAAIPAAVALLSRAFLGERIAPRVAAGIGCAAGGIALLALARDEPGATAPAGPWWGYALLLAAVVCEASYVVIGKRLSARVSPRRVSALINLWGLALVTPFGWWQARGFDFGAMTFGLCALLVFYALSASMVSTWLWLSGLRHVPASHSGVFTIAMPLAASIVAAIFLGESLGLAHAFAFACAAAGILLIAGAGRTATVPVPPRPGSRPGSRPDSI